MSYINSSGFKYRMDSLNISGENLLVAYDFVSGSEFSNAYLTNPPWASGSTISGKLNGNSSQFYKNPGSGFFNGSNNVAISGKIPADDFTFLFCYEKIRSGKEVLLSSAEGSSFSSSSGLVLGVNDANKLYLEYWNPTNGINSLTYDQNISSKNLVFLSASFGEFQLGIFDPIESSLSFSSSSIDSNSYAHSDNFIIGSGKNSFWTKRGVNDQDRAFSGFFDDFYCVTGSLPNGYFVDLFSGFYSIPTGGGISGNTLFCENISTITGSGIIIGTGVTGYETVVTYTTGFVPTGYVESGYLYFVGVGVTGYEEKFIGNVQDACGFINPVYVRTPMTGNIFASGITGFYTGEAMIITPFYENVELTGIITGEVFVPIDVEVCSISTGYFDTSLQIDSNFITSLGFESAYSFFESSGVSVSEIFFYTGNTPHSNINIEPEFDIVRGGWVISNEHTGFRKNLFFSNGQLLMESGWSSYIESGVTKYNITGNIFVDGNLVRSDGYSDFSDDLLYDNSSLISGSWVYLLTGFGSSSSFNSLFPAANYPDYSIFLNGIKLTSGLDHSSLNIFYDIPPSSVLTKINNNYISNEKIYITGSQNLFGLSGSGCFVSNSSQLYTNGIRQSLDEDYVEISRFSLLGAPPISPISNNQLVFSFSEDFWNI